MADTCCLSQRMITDRIWRIDILLAGDVACIATIRKKHSDMINSLTEHIAEMHRFIGYDFGKNF